MDLQQTVTGLLDALAAGDSKATNDLLPLVYDELRRLADIQLAREAPGHTLQPTALVHEAYLRLVGNGNVRWDSRGHFFASAAQSMRRILVERARRRRAIKRGGGRPALPLQDDALVSEPDTVDMLALDEALDRLAAHNERWSRIVLLRYFAGLSIEETALALALSPTSVKNAWVAARAWLHREISGMPPEAGT
jgi:RNA polymerase sigma factor (TIGR02999 family)